MRRDLLIETIGGGFSFLFIYFITGLIFLSIFPDYIENVYNVENLWGVYILGIPLEELVFAFAIGAGFAPFYEFFRGYKLKSGKK